MTSRTKTSIQLEDMTIEAMVEDCGRDDISIDLHHSTEKSISQMIERGWWGSKMEMAIITAVTKYTKSVRKMYQRILDDFKIYSGSGSMCKRCFQKSLPPATVGDIWFECAVRVRYHFIDTDHVAYTIRSPGDKENKKTAIKNIENIIRSLSIISSGVVNAKDRILMRDDNKNVDTIDGESIYVAPLSGIITKFNGKTYLDAIVIDLGETP